MRWCLSGCASLWEGNGQHIYWVVRGHANPFLSTIHTHTDEEQIQTVTGKEETKAAEKGHWTVFYTATAVTSPDSLLTSQTFGNTLPFSAFLQ